MTRMSSKFRVGVTRDVLGPDGRPWFPDLGLDLLDRHDRVEWEVLPEAVDELTADHVQSYDGILLLAPRVTAASLSQGARTAVIARFGVGYDQVDVAACTEAGVALTVTPDGVRRPVASAMLAMVMALAHRIPERDAQVRAGRWAEKFSVIGTGLTGRTLGVVGLGRIGLELCRLARPLDMEMLAFDPYADPEAAAAAGVRLTSLDDVVGRGDFVCIAAPLTEATRHLIDRQTLSRMKPTAYLVNAARGAIVDESALIDALRDGGIAGAALDVFDPEPPAPDNPLLRMDNVLLTPHTIAHTDELYRLCGRSAVQSLLAVADGGVPEHVVNRSVLDTSGFRDKLAERAHRP